MALQKGLSYLYIGKSPEPAYAVFNELAASGMRCLCMTRQNPDVVRERYKVSCPVVWLARTDRFSKDWENIHPEHILSVYTVINAFLRIEGESVIMLDGLEFLIANNDFTSVMKLVALMNERVAIAGARLLIPINPSAIEPKELGLLERECTRIDSN